MSHSSQQKNEIWHKIEKMTTMKINANSGIPVNFLDPSCKFYLKSYPYGGYSFG